MDGVHRQSDGCGKSGFVNDYGKKKQLVAITEAPVLVVECAAGKLRRRDSHFSSPSLLLLTLAKSQSDNRQLEECLGLLQQSIRGTVLKTRCLSSKLALGDLDHAHRQSRSARLVRTSDLWDICSWLMRAAVWLVLRRWTDGPSKFLFAKGDRHSEHKKKLINFISFGCAWSWAEASIGLNKNVQSICIYKLWGHGM